MTVANQKNRSNIGADQSITTTTTTTTDGKNNLPTYVCTECGSPMKHIYTHQYSNIYLSNCVCVHEFIWFATRQTNNFCCCCCCFFIENVSQGG